MKKINTFNINSNPIIGSGESRSYTITGDTGAVFSMVVLNEDGHYYNFPENTIVSAEENTTTPAGSFSATPTKLLTKVLTDGTYNGVINFPKVTDDDEYKIIFKEKAIKNLCRFLIYMLNVCLIPSITNSIARAPKRIPKVL